MGVKSSGKGHGSRACLRVRSDFTAATLFAPCSWIPLILPDAVPPARGSRCPSPG